MKLIIKEHEVLSEKEVTTKSGKTHIVRKGYCKLYKINPSMQEVGIKTNEEVNISFEWQKFNIETEEYQKDEEKDDAFQVEIIKPDGETYDTMELPAGEELEFSAEEAGEYTIRTRNSKVGNAEIKVVVEGD